MNKRTSHGFRTMAQALAFFKVMQMAGRKPILLRGEYYNVVQC